MHRKNRAGLAVTVLRFLVPALAFTFALSACGGRASSAATTTKSTASTAKAGPASPASPAASAASGDATTAARSTAAPATAPAAAPTAAPVAMSPSQGGAKTQAAGSTQASQSGQTAAPKIQDLVLPPAIVAERSYGILGPAGPILPEDAAIGPLQGFRPASTEEAAVLATTKTFLDALLAGKVDEDSIDKGRRTILRDLAAPLAASPKAVAYRVGRLVLAGDAGERSAVAPLRLAWTSAGRATGQGSSPQRTGTTSAAGPVMPGNAYSWRSGEIGLRSTGGAWYVESIHIAAEDGK